MNRHKWLALGLLTLLVLTASQASAAVEYVIEISVDGLGGTYLGKMFDGTAPGGPYAIPNFTRLKNEGASTLAAHIDNSNWETLPNHVSIITARPQMGDNGHNWFGNSDPATTLHLNKGSYVAGVFDVAHDNGLRTGMYANKSKFSLFDTYGSYTGGGSYNDVNGAPDTNPVGGDNGRDKVDNSYISNALGGIIVNTYIAEQKANPMRFAFLHINEPDSYGHSTGWGSTTWYSQVVNVDTMLGKIFKLVEQDVPAMTGQTAIILTADHGNQDDPQTGADRYAVPFFVWGPGVAPGADLYGLNFGLRQPASSYPMTTYGGIQPVRNAEASNLALDLLALGPIPGSTFNYAHDLKIWSAPTLMLTPMVLDKTVAWGINPPTGASFTIRNGGVGTLDYTIVSDATWVAPGPGTSPGSCSTETDIIDLVFTTASLAPGPHVATLTVTSAQAANSPQTVTVNLTVNPAYGDFDGDEDVDQEDFGHLQACLFGTGILTGCTNADFNHSGRVDEVDIGIFFNCMQGPNVAPIPGCGG